MNDIKAADNFRATLKDSEGNVLLDKGYESTTLLSYHEAILDVIHDYKKYKRGEDKGQILTVTITQIVEIK